MLQFASAAFFVFGLTNAFFYAPNLKYLPQVCPKDDQPLALAINIAVTGMAAGISPIIGGYIVKHVDGTPGMLKGPFLVYLVILVCAQFALFIPFRRLKEPENPGESPLLGSLGLHIRFSRYASQLLGMSGLGRSRDGHK
jgi:MFS family permease